MNQGIYGLTRADGRDPSRPWATTREAQRLAASGSVISPASARDAILSAYTIPITMSASNSGSGSTSGGGLANLLSTGTTANSRGGYWVNTGAGYANLYAGGGDSSAVRVNGWRYNASTFISLRVYRYQGGSANSVLQFGVSDSTNIYASIFYSPTIVAEIRNNRYWLVCWANGTQTGVDSGRNYGGTYPDDVVIENDGTGTAKLRVNGEVVATNQNAPAVLTNSPANVYVSLVNNADTTNTGWNIFNWRVSSY